MTQYIREKQIKVTGKKIRLYLSMSEAAMPRMLSRWAGEARLRGPPPTLAPGLSMVLNKKDFWIFSIRE